MIVSRWLFLFITSFFSVQNSCIWSGGVCSKQGTSTVAPVLAPKALPAQPPSPAGSSISFSPGAQVVLMGAFSPVVPGLKAPPPTPVGPRVPSNLGLGADGLEELSVGDEAENLALKRLKLMLVSKGRRGQTTSAWASTGSGSGDESSFAEFTGSEDDVHSFSGVSATEMYGKESEPRGASSVSPTEDSFEDFKSIWLETRKKIIDLRMRLFGFRLFFTTMMDEGRGSELREKPAEMVRLYAQVRDAYHALLQASSPLCMGQVSTPPLPYNKDVRLPREESKLLLLNPPICPCSPGSRESFISNMSNDACLKCGESFLRRIFATSGTLAIGILVGLVHDAAAAHRAMDSFFMRERGGL